MLININNIDYYLVTDSYLSKKGTISDVVNSINAGCKIIQFRDKYKSTKKMIKEANTIKKICLENAIFLVNDRVDVALAVDSDGIHLGQNDMPYNYARKILGKNKIIGITVHNMKEAIKAEKNGADYIGLSPIFNTKTKKDAGRSCGINMINEIHKFISIPIVAIGGINKENVAQVIKAGSNAVVAISAVISSENVYNEVKDFIKIIRENKFK